MTEMARTVNDVNREAREWDDPDGVDDLMERIEDLLDQLMSQRDTIAELEQENERLAAELNDERTARLLADNRIAELEEAIANHRRQITAFVPAKSGTAADQALWWWVQ